MGGRYLHKCFSKAMKLLSGGRESDPSLFADGNRAVDVIFKNANAGNDSCLRDIEVRGNPNNSASLHYSRNVCAIPISELQYLS